MKIAYVMNCIERYELTKEVTEHNLKCAGHRLAEILITDNGSQDTKLHDWIEATATRRWMNTENEGNPQMLNWAMHEAFNGMECDAIVKMDNDIKMQQGWLRKAVDYADVIPQTGLIGWPTEEHKPNLSGLIHQHVNPPVLGSWFIPKETFKAVGYFSTFSKYGLWDGEYCNRVVTSGRLCYSIPGQLSQHMIDDLGTSTPYRLMKDGEVKKALTPIGNRMHQVNVTGKHYVTLDNELK